MNIALNTITGGSVSEAWLNTVLAISEFPDRTACHVVTRVARADAEEGGIRAAADELSALRGYRPIGTVANTIFPAQLARACGDERELGERYRRMHPTIRTLEQSNRRGTYFGRLVAYPTGEAACFDQLSDLVRKLNVERASPGPKTARYELGFEAPGTPDDDGSPSESDGSPAHEGACYDGVASPVYIPGEDTSPMGFPCLSFCSFQLDHGHLHLVAHYRRQHLIERGYGNYLGLGRLLSYTSERIGVTPGQLMVVAGVATVDAPLYRIRALVERREVGAPPAG